MHQVASKALVARAAASQGGLPYALEMYIHMRFVLSELETRGQPSLRIDTMTLPDSHR